MEELRKITQEQLEEILHKHKLWLLDKEGGEKADLSYVDLAGADLTGANLRCANLIGANLEYANLEYANLTNTILQDTTPNENKEDTKEEIKVLETNSMDFNKIFDIVRYAIDNKNVNEIIVIEDKIEIEIKNKNH